MAAFDDLGREDAVFRALADPSRRRLLDDLNARSGQTLRELCAGLDMARQSVSKHLAVLEAAGLVTTVRRGREKLHHLDAAPINAIADRWINRYTRERVQALADLTTALEDPDAMTATEFAYTTYIQSTPQRVWQALTDPAFTRRYWGVALESDWKAGSPVAWVVHDKVRLEHPEQVVLEADPPRRLSYTFHTFTPEFAEEVGLDQETLETIGRERRSRVTWQIEEDGPRVKLTLVHDDFDPGSRVLELVSGGWTPLLASLKTLLETGEPLPEPVGLAQVGSSGSGGRSGGSGARTRSGRVAAEERLLERPGLVHGDDEQGCVADVAKAVRRLGGHHDELLGAKLGDDVPGRPPALALQQQEGLGVGVDVELDGPARRRAGDEDRGVAARGRPALEQRRRGAEPVVVEIPGYDPHC
jgi:DNA-binding transcriptional ArsR family regulator/uncharacterized protein YndB with AHSA1/START domain